MRSSLMAYCSSLHLFSCLVPSVFLLLASTHPVHTCSPMFHTRTSSTIPLAAISDGTSQATTVARTGAAATAASSHATDTNLPASAAESSSLADPALASAFDSWAAEHRLTFSQADRDTRLPIFARNLAFIHEHNSAYGSTGNRIHNSTSSSYTLGLNAFSHLTQVEFASLMGTKRQGRSRGRSARVVASGRSVSNSPGRNSSAGAGAGSEGRKSGPIVGAIPTAVDWRAKGKVTSVKSQGSDCASPYAFAAAAAVESLYAIKKAKLYNLSPQQIVDCSDAEGNFGCFQGHVEWAFEYIQKHGITYENKYPYLGEDSRGCGVTKSMQRVFISSYTESEWPSDRAMRLQVSKQPVVVYLDKSAPQFQHYKKGIYTGPCSADPYWSTGYMTVVGYGSEKGKPYWILKNSWGTSWGEKGYMRLLMSRKAPYDLGGMCGMSQRMYFPSIK